MRRWCHAFALLIAARVACRAGAGFPEQAGPRDRLVERRRHQRHLHPHRRRRAAQEVGPAAGRGEPPRRPVQHRRQGLRRRAARRLHHLHPSLRRAAVQPLRFQIAELRSVQGYRAGLAAVLSDAGPCGVVVAQRQHAGRARRLFQGASEDAVLFRGGHSAPAFHRRLQGGNRRRYRARAVPRRRRGGQRHADRNDAGCFLRHRQLHRASAGRHHPRHRGRCGQALAAVSQHPDLAGAAPQRRSDPGRLQPVGAEGHPAGDHPQDPRRRRRDRQRSGVSRRRISFSARSIRCSARPPSSPSISNSRAPRPSAPPRKPTCSRSSPTETENWK